MNFRIEQSWLIKTLWTAVVNITTVLWWYKKQIITLYYHSVDWFLYDWITWATWIKHLPNVSNMHCEMYAWNIVCHIKNENPSFRLAVSANHNSRSPNFPLISLKFKVSSLKKDSRQILVCASFKYVNKICQNNICQ